MLYLLDASANCNLQKNVNFILHYLPKFHFYMTDWLLFCSKLYHWQV